MDLTIIPDIFIIFTFSISGNSQGQTWTPLITKTVTYTIFWKLPLQLSSAEYRKKVKVNDVITKTGHLYGN